MAQNSSPGRRPSRRTERQRERTRLEILETARAILGNDGVNAVTLASVSGELGLTKPALYHYFPSKEVLIRNLVVMLLNDEIECLLDAVDAERDEARVLGAMIRAFYAHYNGRLNEFRMVYCQSQLLSTPADVFDRAVLTEEINPRTQHLFDVLEARLSRNSRSAARRARYRQLAYSAWLAALGLVTMLGVAEATQDPLVHSDTDLVEELANTFDGSVA